MDSTEIRLNILDEDFRAKGQEAINLVRKYAENTEGWHIAPDNREGIRISFDLNGIADAGWFLLRLSVHDPVMPLNVESDTSGGVKIMLTALYQALRGIKGINLEPIEKAIKA